MPWICWLEETDELDEFQVKAVIAADGVNSEVAQITRARPKFSAVQLYQGVKAIVKYANLSKIS